MKTKLNLREAKKIIEMSYKINIPVILLGSPGLGKTAIFHQLGLPVAIFEGPGTDDIDVKGYVFPDKENKTSYYGKSALYPDFDKGILLIDELASARPEVMVALHSLFGDRRLGPHKLPEGVVPMATGNRVQDRAGARRLLTALEDRLTVIEVISDAKIWLEDYAIKNNLHPLITSFFKHSANHMYLDTFDSAKPGEEFATPRSWDILSKYLYEIDKEENIPENILMALFETKIGYTAASAFITWYRYKPYLKLMDVIINTPELIESKLKEYKLVKNDDAFLAVAFATYNHLIQTNNTADIHKILNLLELVDKATGIAFLGAIFEEIYTDKRAVSAITKHPLYQAYSKEYVKLHTIKKGEEYEQRAV